MRFAVIVRRMLSTRNRRAGIALLTIVVAWNFGEFLVIGHTEEWRGLVAKSIIVLAIVLALAVVAAGQFVARRSSRRPENEEASKQGPSRPENGIAPSNLREEDVNELRH